MTQKEQELAGLCHIPVGFRVVYVMRVIESSGNRVMNLGGTTVAKSGRMIGFGAFSLLTGLYCAGLCTAALLHVMGAVSMARWASSTSFIVGVAAASLGWALWRAYRRQRACADNDCPSPRAVGLTAIIAVVAFVGDVVL